MNEINKKRIVIYDVIRVIAVVLVLMGHATYLKIVANYGGVIYSIDNISVLFKTLQKLSNIIYIFHMPLFVSISGALFYNSLNKSNFCFSDFITKKFIKLIIPYLGYGILYNILIKYMCSYYILDCVPYAVVFETIFGKNITQHIWYLPSLLIVIILYYIIYFCLIKKNDKKMIIITILLAFFHDSINVVLPGCKYIILLLVFFECGALFEKYREKLTKKNIYFFIVVSIIAFLLVIVLHFILKGKNVLFISSFIKCIQILSFLVFWYSISCIISRIKLIVNSKIFLLINKYAFDIYILGDPLNYVVLYVIYKLNLIWIYSSNFGTIFSYLLRTVGIMFFSIVFSNIIKKILKNSIIKKIVIMLWGTIVFASFIVVIYNSIIDKEPTIKPFIANQIENKVLK